MMFRSRQQASKCLILTAGTNNSNRRHFLFIKQQQQQYHHQTKLLLGCYANNSKKGVGGGDCNKKTMFLMEQKRFFALDAFFSSSSGQQKEQQTADDDEKGFPGEEQQKSPVQTHRDLAKKWLQLDAASRLQLTLGQGKSGWKFFGISKSFEHRRTKSNKIIIGNRDFPNLTLELGHPLVNAMDALLNSLLAKHQQQQDEIINNQASDEHQPAAAPVLLESQRVNGPYFDLQLEIVQLGGNNDSDVYQFNMKTIKTVQEHREHELSMPVQALPWLRHEMAQMLVEHDDDGGGQQLGPAPPELPESILQAQPTAVHNQRQQQEQRQQFASHQQPLSIQQALKKALLPDDLSSSSSSTSPFSSAQQYGQQQHSHEQPLSIQQALKKALLPDDSSSSSPFSSAQQHEQQLQGIGGGDCNKKTMLPLLSEQKRSFFADSSSSGQKHEQQTADDDEKGFTGEEQQQNSPVQMHRFLAKKWLQLDATNRLQLHLRQGKNRKFFGISKSFEDTRSTNNKHIKLPNLALEGGHSLVEAMDALLNALVSKHEELNHSSESRPLVLESQRVNGPFFDFQLELVWIGNAYQFNISTIKTVQEHKEQELRFPVQALPWLRHTMAQMLAEHDQHGNGSQQQQLGPAPPELQQQQQPHFASHQQPLSIQQALKKALLPD